MRSKSRARSRSKRRNNLFRAEQPPSIPAVRASTETAKKEADAILAEIMQNTNHWIAQDFEIRQNSTNPDQILSDEEAKALELVRFHPFCSAKKILDNQSHEHELDCTKRVELRWFKTKDGRLYWFVVRKVVQPEISMMLLLSTSSVLTTDGFNAFGDVLRDSRGDFIFSNQGSYIRTHLDGGFRTEEDCLEEQQRTKTNEFRITLFWKTSQTVQQSKIYKVLKKCSYWERLQQPVNVIRHMGPALRQWQIDSAGRIYAPGGSEYEAIKQSFERLQVERK